MSYHSHIRAGYYHVLGASFADHTYVIVDNGPTRYAFPCFGGFAFEGKTYGQTGLVWPADLWTPYTIGSQKRGNYLEGNLYVALGIAQCRLDPQFNWTPADWDAYWVGKPIAEGVACHSGVAYGVVGVCHQIANRILWASRRGQLYECPVVWPPSFSFSKVPYGYWGEISNPIGTSLMARFAEGELTARADARGGGMLAMAAAADSLEADESVGVGAGEQADQVNGEFREANGKALRDALSDARQYERRHDHLEKLVAEAAPGGDTLASPASRAGVFEADSKFQGMKTELDKQLLRAEISHDEYATRVNRGFQEYIEELHNVLPPATFHAMLPDYQEGATFQLINRTEMPASYAEFQETAQI